MIDYTKQYTYREAFETLGFEELLAHAILHGVAHIDADSLEHFVTFTDPSTIKVKHE